MSDDMVESQPSQRAERALLSLWRSLLPNTLIALLIVDPTGVPSVIIPSAAPLSEAERTLVSDAIICGLERYGLIEEDAQTDVRPLEVQR